VGNGAETERFVFYEADTTERPALSLERGDSWAPDRPHYVLHNTASWPVHDVFFSAGGHVFYAPAIPAGATAGFLLNEHNDANPAQTLRALLVDSSQPSPTPQWNMSDDCVMTRDPSIPVTKATGHRLYAGEVDTLLSVWADRLFPATPTVVYREDAAALEALMPLSVYTDMYHYVDLSRLGLVVVENVDMLGGS